MLAPDQLVQPEDDERSRSDVLEHVQRDHDLRGQDRRYHEGDGGGVSQGDGPEGLKNRLPAALLQSQAHREEPAHRGVQAVVSAQQDQGEPGPVLVRHVAHDG
jgi:hypothetical protein